MKTGKHCFLGEDYDESCEDKNCTAKELCKKLHDEKIIKNKV